jgi:O-antigen/teichoic acid export membrane protein
MLAAALTAVTAWMAVLSLQVLTSESFRGFQDLRLASIFGGVITGVATLSALAILITRRGTASLGEAIWVSAAAGGLSLVIGLTILRRRLATLPANESIRSAEVFSISLPLWVSGVTAFLLSQSALWILGAFLSKEDVGLYFAAVRLVTLVSMPLILVNLVVPPFIAELHARQETVRLQRVLRSAATLAGLPAFAVLSAFVLFGAPIMGLVFGETYRAGAPILALLSVGYLVNVWTGSCGVTLSMTGHQTVLMRITLASGVLVVGGALLVVQRFGTIGVATVVCATAILQNLTMWIAARYQTGLWTHATIPTARDIRSLLSRAPSPPDDNSGD